MKKQFLFFTLLTLMFVANTAKAQYTLDGPSVVSLNTTERYTLNTNGVLLPQQPQAFTFWLNGAGTVQQRSKTTADIYFSPYYTNGSVCLGMNFGTFPYYIQVCKEVTVADFTISVGANPSYGEFTLYYTSATLPFYDLKVINQSTGEVKLDLPHISQPVELFGKYYPAGNYTLMVTAGGKTKTLTLIKL